MISDEKHPDHPNAKLVRVVERHRKKYEIWSGLDLPPRRHGPQKRDERNLIEKYIQGRVDGVYKNHSHGASEIAKEINEPWIFLDSHKKRLRDKFRAAWNLYEQGLPFDSII